MVREMHPDAVRADAIITKYQFLVNLDPRGKKPEEVVGLALRLHGAYGEIMEPVEVLNRAPGEVPEESGLAVKEMPMLTREGLIAILGSNDDERDEKEVLRLVKSAIEKDAFGGYVSFGGVDDPVIRTSLEAQGGMRLAIACLTTPGEFSSENRVKKQAAGVRSRSFLPQALKRFKIFPMVENLLIQPGRLMDSGSVKKEEWNNYLRRILGTMSTGELNHSALITGFDRAEQTLPSLHAKYVGGMPFNVAIGAKVDSVQDAFPYLEAIAAEQGPNSPILPTLIEVRSTFEDVIRLKYPGKIPKHIREALGMRRRRVSA